MYASNESKNNSSTLSLHIAAYENSIEAAAAASDSFEGINQSKNKFNFGKNLKNLKHMTLPLNNSLEFLRQQMDDATNPTVMQFTASQKLLNPNQGNDNSVTENRTMGSSSVLSTDSPRIQGIQQQMPVFDHAQLINKIIMGDDPSIVAKRKCLKCDLPAGYYSHNPKQAVYCKQCFINMVHHKFSYVLGKNRIFKDGSAKDVLLIWRGSLSDDFLLETVKTGVTQDAHKRLEAQPQVLVILESIQTEQLKAEYSKAMKRQAELGMPWKWNFIHFSEIFKQSIEFIDEEPSIDQGKASVLKYLFGKTSAKNDRLEFKRCLTELLIYRAAKVLNIEKVMVSDSAEKMAQNSFDALCFGRGSSISQLTAPVDSRFPKVSIIRPLREIYDAEIQMVLKLESLVKDFEEIKLDQVQLKSSKTVQDMNAEFLSKLQASGFPSTLTSVVSTSSKIRAPPNSAAINSCCLCYEKSESSDFCPACDRLLQAIPGFPNELRSFLVDQVF